MVRPFYTLARWRVKEGREEEFVEAWVAMGDAFGAVPGSPSLEGTLLQGVEDARTFYSFGGWESLEQVARMREDAGAREAVARVRALCEEASPGAYRVVRVARSGPSA